MLQPFDVGDPYGFLGSHRLLFGGAPSGRNRIANFKIEMARIAIGVSASVNALYVPRKRL
jgi:hypothetical protein